MHHINQRKGHYFIQAQSADKDDKDDEYDSGIFTDRNAQNLRRIKQRKGHCFFQISSDDVDDKDDDLITPYTYQEIPFPSVSTTPEQPPVEACVPICAILSKKSEKYPPQGIHGLNRRFQRECFSKPCYTALAQKLRRIKQRKGRCFIQASSDDKDDQGDDMRFLYCRFLHLTVSRS